MILSSMDTEINYESLVTRNCRRRRNRAYKIICSGQAWCVLTEATELVNLRANKSRAVLYNIFKFSSYRARYIVIKRRKELKGSTHEDLTRKKKKRLANEIIKANQGGIGVESGWTSVCFCYHFDTWKARKSTDMQLFGLAKFA